MENTENGEFKDQIRASAPLLTNKEIFTDFGFHICKEMRYIRDSLFLSVLLKKNGRAETRIKYSPHSFISLQQMWSTWHAPGTRR